MPCLSTCPLKAGLFAGEHRCNAEVKHCFPSDASLQLASHTGVTGESQAGRHPPWPHWCPSFWATVGNRGHFSISGAPAQSRGEASPRVVLCHAFPHWPSCENSCPWGFSQMLPQPILVLIPRSTEEGCKGPAFFLPFSSRRSSCGHGCLRHVWCLRSPDSQAFKKELESCSGWSS